MTLKATVRAFADRLPEPRGNALLGTLRSIRTLVTGVDPAQSRPPSRRRTSSPPPPPVDDSLWPTPHLSTDISRRVPASGSNQPPTRFTVELLESLNREYADRPLVASAPSYQTGSLQDAARRRVRWVHSMVDLRAKRVLEIGCGSGLEAWFAVHGFGADVDGVDIVEWTTWNSLQGDKVRFHIADLATERPFAGESFDRIVSFTVWEHVKHPYGLLEETYRLLKPGGLAWIRANLYLGPKASHRYRDIYFPWPHLLFDDAVIADWDRLKGRETNGASWVNRLTWCQYRTAFRKVGFEIVHHSFDETPIDEDFYARFEDILGRYPREDLTKDFFLVVLQKPL